MKCARCSASIEADAAVMLGRRHGFCSHGCRNIWAVDRVLHLEDELNRIYIRSRGRAREIAHNALVGNVPSIGGKAA